MGIVARIAKQREDGKSTLQFFVDPMPSLGIGDALVLLDKLSDLCKQGALCEKLDQLPMHDSRKSAELAARVGSLFAAAVTDAMRAFGIAGGLPALAQALGRANGLRADRALVERVKH